MPLFIVLEFTDSKFRPQLLGGINLGYLLSANVEAMVNGNQENYDAKPDYNDIDLALDFGLGMDYNMNQFTNLLLSVRYSNF